MSSLVTLLKNLRPFGSHVEDGDGGEGHPSQPLFESWPALLSLGAVTLLALLLRWHDYPIAPGPTDAPEEYSHAWAGFSMLHGHLPSGASSLAAYAGHTQEISFLGLSFRLVRPWLDHQPLFGLLPGLVETITGARSFQDMSLSSLRVPSLVLGVLTVVLGYSLARRLLPPLGSLLAAFLLAVEPGLVLLGRLGVPEVLLAPALMWVILLVTPGVPESQAQGSAGVGPAPEQAPSRRLMVLVAALCGLAPLIGLNGLVIPVTSAGLLYSRGLRRHALWAAAAGAGGLVLLILFGLLSGGGLLFSAWSQQAAGGGGILSGVLFITGSIGAGHTFIDAWYIFAWLALGYLSGNAKRRHRFRLLLWPIAAYLALVVPFLPQQELATHGWLRLPIMPLLLIGAVAALYAAVREGQLLLPATGLFSAGLWSIQWLFPSPWRPGAVTLLVLGLAALVPAAIAEVNPRGAPRDAAQGVWAAVALLSLAGLTVLSWNLAIRLGELG